MFGGILNVLMGVFCLVCGLCDFAQLIGTKTGTPLAILGAVLVVLGSYRLWRWWRRRQRALERARSEPEEGAEP